MENKLSASEAIFGFAAWLASRDRPTIFSVHHDCSGIGDLIKVFCKKNKIDSPRGHWTINLILPDEGDVLL